MPRKANSIPGGAKFPKVSGRTSGGFTERRDGSGASVFDPVMCELAYRWFCPPGGLVLDPFAGGSVRGLVAGMLDRRYVGVELRAEQVAANRAQLGLLPAGKPQPQWHCGDAADVLTTDELGGAADFIFSCPPYADLERYSDDARDLSTMPYPAFLEAYRRIVAAACALLAPDRFAAFVVGDARDADGFFYGFPEDKQVLMRLAQRTTRVRQFSGEAVDLPAGTILMRELVGSGAPLRRVVERVAKHAGTPAVLAALVHVEQRELWGALGAVGLRWRTTQVLASSELRGLFLAPGAHPQVPPLPLAEAASLVELEPPGALDVRPALAALAAATAGEKAAPPWEQHYSSYNLRQSWTAFAARGYDPRNPGFIQKPAEMSRAWKGEHAELLDATPEWLPGFEKLREFVRVLTEGREVDRVRFMRLAPGGGLSRHADITDRSAGVAPGRIARLHVPLVSDPGCRFSQWDARGEQRVRHLAPGGLYYLDQRKPHAVRNASPRERIHLVVDVVSDALLERWVRDAAAAEEARLCG